MALLCAQSILVERMKAGAQKLQVSVWARVVQRASWKQNAFDWVWEYEKDYVCGTHAHFTPLTPYPFS